MSETQEAAVPGAEAKGKGNEAKEARKAARQAQAGASKAVLDTQVDSAEGESNFGYLPLNRSQQKRAVREWTDVGALTADKKNEAVWLRGRVYLSRLKGNLGFITLRQGQHTVQCVLDAAQDASQDMLKWAGSIHIFEGLSSEKYREDVETIRKIHPSTPFKWAPKGKTPRLTFQEGIQLLRDAGCPDVPDDITNFDLGTEQEKVLGKLIREKYDCDFFMLIGYPTAVRAFYSMPREDNPAFSNSYDFFMRGEEITSGAQRITDPTLLSERAVACGIDPATIKGYIDAFRYGAPPHGGAGIGMERVIMLFLGLNNIRKVSMFPRDPKRLTP
eukprot:Selendium_serpulae@DN5592_c0_g1_i3.p4